MDLIIYSFSFGLLWHAWRRSMGWFYAIAYSYTIILSLIILGSVVSQIVFGNTRYIFIALSTLSLCALLMLNTKKEIRADEKSSPYTVIVAVILCLFVVYAYGFNSIRFYNTRGNSIPVVGTNDDNANHMAMAAVAIKDRSMLWSSERLQKMIDDSTLLAASKWYPFGLYTNMSVGYELFKNILGVKERFDLRSFFSFNTIFTVGLLLNLIILFYGLTDRLYKVRTVHTFAISLIIGLMVVLGEYFLKLQLYGFHSQLAGYCAFVALLLTLDSASKDNKLSYSSVFLICIFIVAVGVSYYLFIPLAGLAYLIFHIESQRDKRRLIPYIALAVSIIPLILFNRSFSITAQIESWGVAFVGFTGLMTSALGILLSVLMRHHMNERLRRMHILLYGLSIVMMIVGTISMYTKSGNFGYYFFKSYWTMGIIGLPMLIAYVGYLGDAFKKYAAAITLISVVIAGGIIYGVFSQPGYDSRGYDTIMMIHNGYYNYPFNQRKWIKTYEKYGNNNGKNIYSIGIWGQSVLARALYEDTPDFLKSTRKFDQSLNEVEHDALVFEHILQRLFEKKHTVLLDDFNKMNDINQRITDPKQRELFKLSPYLE